MSSLPLSSNLNISNNNISNLGNIRGNNDDDDDYDFVFKIGNKNSLIRCRLLLSLFTKSKHSNNNNGNAKTWIIILLIVVIMFAMLFCLYAFGTFVTLITSIVTVLADSTQFIHQISKSSFGYNIIDQNYTIYSDLNIKHCNELMDLISVNPSSDVLQKTYDSLNCHPINKS